MSIAVPTYPSVLEPSVYTEQSPSPPVPERSIFGRQHPHVLSNSTCPQLKYNHAIYFIPNMPNIQSLWGNYTLTVTIQCSGGFYSGPHTTLVQKNRRSYYHKYLIQSEFQRRHFKSKFDLVQSLKIVQRSLLKSDFRYVGVMQTVQLYCPKLQQVG